MNGDAVVDEVNAADVDLSEVIYLLSEINNKLSVDASDQDAVSTVISEYYEQQQLNYSTVLEQYQQNVDNLNLMLSVSVLSNVVCLGVIVGVLLIRRLWVS